MGTIANEIQRLQNAKASIKTSIENKGVVVPSTTKLDGYSTLIDQISQGTTEVESKDVDFYDYDGTRLYSYTKQEFLALNEMPANPTHEGLTSQGWNWSLANAKTYVNTYGELDIAQYYCTSDDKTHIYINVDNADFLNVSMRAGTNGTLTLEWGDGTIDTLTSTNINADYLFNHTYSSTGKYVIKVSSTNQLRFRGIGQISQLLFDDVNGTKFGADYVYKVEIGKNVIINDGTFAQLSCLEEIVMNKDAITTSNSLDSLYFRPTSLKFIVYPKFSSVNILLENAFNLKGVSVSDSTSVVSISISYSSQIARIPANYSSTNSPVVSYSKFITKTYFTNQVQVIKSSAYRECYHLGKTIVYPASITTIEGYAFISDTGILVHDFRNATSMPTLQNVYGYYYPNNNMKIVVPDALYSTWIAATNWSSYASRIIRESDYND